MNNLTVIEVQGQNVVDSRLIANELGVEHKSFIRTIRKYETELSTFGVLGFARAKPPKGSAGGRPEDFYYLNEDQVRFILGKTRGGLSKKSIRKLQEIGLDLSLYVAKKSNRKKKKESNYSDDLAKKLCGKREVGTIAGNIDILTNEQVIEVKAVPMWKAALGQVLVYGTFYPSHQKRIHLYGETQESFLKMIKQHCQAFGIVMTWEP